MVYDEVVYDGVIGDDFFLFIDVDWFYFGVGIVYVKCNEYVFSLKMCNDGDEDLSREVISFDSYGIDIVGVFGYNIDIMQFVRDFIFQIDGFEDWVV